MGIDIIPILSVGNVFCGFKVVVSKLLYKVLYVWEEPDGGVIVPSGLKLATTAFDISPKLPER